MADVKDPTENDVTIVIGDRRIKAEKHRLIASSKYFKALFQSGMKESSDGEVILHDLDENSLEKVVEYTSKGRIEVTEENVQDILIVANFLDVWYVRQKCIKFISDRIDCQNVAGVYTLGKQLEESDLYLPAVNFSCEKFAELSSSEEFVSIPSELFDAMLLSEELQFYKCGIVPIPSNQETGVLEAVLKYVSHDVGSRLGLLPRYLSNLRLCTILPSRLRSFKNHDLICNSSECLGLIDKALQIQKNAGQAAGTGSDLNNTAWKKPRENNLLETSWSQRYASGREINDRCSPYDDSEHVTPGAYVTGMTMWSRRWDGREVLGGYQVAFSDGTVVQHGDTSLDRERYDIRMQEGEVIVALDVNSGWAIDQITYHTSLGRVIGPCGGGGGSRRHTQHGGSHRNDGFLVGTRGVVAWSQHGEIITCLSFNWCYIERPPEPEPVNASDAPAVEASASSDQSPIDNRRTTHRRHRNRLQNCRNQ